MKPEPERLVASGLSPAQIDKLKEYQALLIHRGLPLGLIAGSDRDRIWDRHIMDSLRALALLGPEHATLLDMGSGGGLPGLPLAIARPASRVLLVESRQLRASFLEMVVERLGVANVGVVPHRVEATNLRVDAALARAFGTAPECWRLADAHLGPAGILIYWAGSSWTVSDEVLVDEAGARLEIGDPASPGRQGPLVMMRRKGSVPGPGQRLGEEHEDGAGGGRSRP